MTARFSLWRCLAVLVAVVGVPVTPSPAQAQLVCDPCTIGVVLDGPWERNDDVRLAVEREVLALVGDTVELRFPPEKRLLADWTFDGAREAVEAELDDPGVDILITSGPVASTYVGRRATLPKPVVAAFVIDPEIQGLPVTTNDVGERVSGTPNLTYVTFPGDLALTLPRFREVAAFDHLTFLVSAGLADAVPELLDNARQDVRGLDVQLEVVPVADSVDDAVAAIPSGTDAVYLAPLIQLPPGEFDRLVRALIARRLPSFSYWGRSEVEQGVLTSLFLETDVDRLARRIAVNVQRLLRGEAAGEIAVDMRRRQRLTLNLATARAIGVYPSWSVMTEAEIVQGERQDVDRRLDLASAARLAVESNLDLLASARTVAAGEQDVRIARSALFPQFAASGLTQVIDEDRARAGLGSQPQLVAVGSASLTQLIYSEEARAGVDVERLLQVSRVAQRRETRLDVIRDAAVGYLDVLRAKAFERIQRENLTTTRSNLELAQTRQRLGVARASEVIRWEAQIANNRRDVIEAGAQRNIAEIALNRLLSRPLEEPFETVEADLQDPELVTTAARLDPYLNNPYAFDIFRDFMTQEAVALAPEIVQLDAAIQAQERLVVAAGRAFWAPTVTMHGDLSGVATGGAGADFAGSLPGDFTLPSRNAVNWTLGVSAQLPIFTGGARRGARARAQQTLARLRFDRQAVADRVEQRVRSALHAAGASYAGIELATQASNAARRNLALVTDAYEQGALSILDLIDAQNAALVADELAASARYDYLIDLMQVQRGIGRFDFFMPPDARQAFLARLEAFFASAGYRPGGTQQGQ